MNIVRALFSLILASVLVEVSGQSFPGAMAYDLSLPDPVSGAKITIREEGNVAQIAGEARNSHHSDKIKGYRVRIFFDNSQWARSGANEALSRFTESFPAIPAYIEHVSPYFKVAVGDCVTYDEVLVVWGKVKGMFPKSFIVREDIPLENLAAAAKKEEAAASIPADSTYLPLPAL